MRDPAVTSELLRVIGENHAERMGRIESDLRRIWVAAKDGYVSGREALPALLALNEEAVGVEDAFIQAVTAEAAK